MTYSADINPQIILTQEIKDQFVRFLMRDGWTYTDATNEIKYMTGMNAVLVSQENYVYFVRRVGAICTLTRVGRKGVYMTMENAINHVTFAEAT